MPKKKYYNKKDQTIEKLRDGCFRVWWKKGSFWRKGKLLDRVFTSLSSGYDDRVASRYSGLSLRRVKVVRKKHFCKKKIVIVKNMWW